MPKKIFLSLYHKLFFIVSQSPNTVLLVQSYRLRRLRKAWLNKPECSAGLPSIGKCVIGVCYSEGWTFLPSFWKSSPLLLEGGNEWAMRCTPRSAMTSLDSLRTASHHLISDAKASYSVVVCAAPCERSLWMYATMGSVSIKFACVEDHNKVLVSWNILHELLHVFNFEKIPKLVRYQNGYIRYKLNIIRCSI